MNQLDSLRKLTKVVADSGDIEDIYKYNIQDVTTNPSIILKVTNLSKYQYLLDDALLYAKNIGGEHVEQLINAINKLIVNIGTKILNTISGCISVEIDACHSFHIVNCISEAHKIIALFQNNGINKSRILIKLAATWEGIQAAKKLQQEGINCNLTLLFSFAQARACAEAGVYLISPFVGRIYDWYDQHNLIDKPYNPNNDPGIKSVYKIYEYYKKYNYKTIIMGASFRNIEQIKFLAGCDYLTIAPKFLEQLINNYNNIERKLFPCNKCYINTSHVLSESEFRWYHNQDAMAVDKLAEGIRKFAFDQQSLKDILATKL